MKTPATWKAQFFGEVLPNFLQGTGYCVLTHHVERLQWLVGHGGVTYTWATGHLSCFGVAGWWTAWLLALNALVDVVNVRFGVRTRPRRMRLLIYLLVPAMLTFHEFVPFFSRAEAVFDWQDIVCYCAGTLTVFVVAAPLRLLVMRHASARMREDD